VELILRPDSMDGRFLDRVNSGFGYLRFCSGLGRKMLHLFIYLFIFKIISKFVIFLFTHKNHKFNNNLNNKKIRKIYK
jgi:hypothetical protein